MVDSLLEFIHPSLLYFNNESVCESVNCIMNNSTEADNQIHIYNKLGFSGLNKYLSENIQYT